MEIVVDFIFLGSEITADGDYSHEIERPLLLEIKAMTNLDSVGQKSLHYLEKQRHYLANKGSSSQSYEFSSSHVWM